MYARYKVKICENNETHIVTSILRDSCQELGSCKALLECPELQSSWVQILGSLRLDICKPKQKKDSRIWLGAILLIYHYQEDSKVRLWICRLPWMQKCWQRIRFCVWRIGSLSEELKKFWGLWRSHCILWDMLAQVQCPKKWFKGQTCLVSQDIQPTSLTTSSK